MYQASIGRYESMLYNHCGESGLKLPAVSLGLWHNFGDNASYENMKQILFTAFDNGVTHFDLANVGASKPSQILDNIGALKNAHFTEEELRLVDEVSFRYNTER